MVEDTLEEAFKKAYCIIKTAPPVKHRNANNVCLQLYKKFVLPGEPARKSGNSSKNTRKEVKIMNSKLIEQAERNELEAQLKEGYLELVEIHQKEAEFFFPAQYEVVQEKGD
ncbi:MAG: hypothetical protein PWQ91_415 [Eubacteriales bacterium]|nr:hypothetical protein [Eubacteriales bacterium]MDN5363354.1 hypothetical protein [Eubacteriales bacterium]